MTNITDNSYNSTGYEGGGQLIKYDLNGNMKEMPDKGITAIKYNHLNLSNYLHLNRNNIEDITVNTKYGADGTKLRKENITTITGIISSTTTKTTVDYLDGFQYTKVDAPNTGGGGSPEMFSARAMAPQAYSLDSESKGPVGVKTPDLQFLPTAEGFYDYINDQYIYQYKDHLGNVRVSFARNSTGALQLKDNNDYYPFGMNHLKTGNAYFGLASYKNYKFGGKELQEFGAYDFGARIYMADIGRWTGIDAYAEVSRRWNPYNYAFDNPVKFVDPDGNLIYINDGQNQFRYDKGKTEVYNCDTMAWENVADSKIKMSAFVTAIVSSLFLLENGGGTSSTLVGFFEKKENDIKIQSTTAGNYYLNGAAYINLSSVNDKFPTVDGYLTRPLFIALGHEMAHGMDPERNSIIPQTWVEIDGVKIDRSEIYASHVENKIRAEWGISLRSSYAIAKNNKDLEGQEVKTILVDKFGNSVQYDNREKQINGVSGSDKFQAYDSFFPERKVSPLTKRYNYYENTPQPNFLRLFLLYHSVNR